MTTMLHDDLPELRPRRPWSGWSLPLDSSHNLCKWIQTSEHGAKSGSDKMQLSDTRFAVGVFQFQYSGSFLPEFRTTDQLTFQATQFPCLPVHSEPQCVPRTHLSLTLSTTQRSPES